MNIYSPTISGSLTISGSIITTGGGLPLTGSLVSSGSFTSIGPTIISGSLSVITGSSIEFQVLDAGVKIGNIASDNHNVTGSVLISGSITTTGNIIAQTLVVQTVTSSVSFITGSTKFGSLASNTHQFTGSLLVTGSGTFISSVSAGTNFRLGGASYGQIAIIDGSGGFGGGYNFNLNSGTPQHDSTGAMAAYYYDSSGNIRFFASSSQAGGTAAQERMRITPAGSVSIGSSTVYNGGGFGRVLSIYETSTVALSLVTSAKQFQVGISGTDNDYRIYDFTNTTYRFAINVST